MNPHAEQRRQDRRTVRTILRGGLTDFELHSAASELIAAYGWPWFAAQQRKRHRAKARQNQAIWLRLRRAEMEDRLDALGLPRDCWGEIWWHGLLEGTADEPEPLDHVEFSITSPEPVRIFYRDDDGSRKLLHETPRGSGPLYDFLVSRNRGRRRADHEKAAEAFWAACAARTAWFAAHTRNAELRFVLGRILEACRANLLVPSRGLDLARSQFARWGSNAHPGKAGDREKAWDTIMDAANRLERNNFSQRAAARHLADDAALQQRLKQLTGDTYGEDAIRKLLRDRNWLRGPA